MSVSQLNLGLTLKSGQAFTWSQKDEGIWVGVVGKNCIFLKNDDDHVVFSSYPVDASETEKDVRDLFQLDVDMLSLYSDWAAADPSFKEIVANPKFQGLRILRQCPFECTFSFIISQNNNVKRISSILRSVRENYGTKLLELADGSALHSWPDLETIASVEDGTWRLLGLGYRAKYYQATSKQLLAKGGVDTLFNLRGKQIDEVREYLTSFTGIGRKVADCISLFSLDFAWLVPCDVHVLKIANKKYFSKPEKDHDRIQSKFQHIFGPYAGWAHSVLFANELSEFKPKNEKVEENHKKLKIEKEYVPKIKMEKGQGSSSLMTDNSESPFSSFEGHITGSEMILRKRKANV